jgi:hypothetical protein
MKHGTIRPPGIPPKPGDSTVQTLSGACGKRGGNNCLRRISLRGQQHSHKIDRRANIGRSLAERFTKRGHSARAVTRKSQGLTQVVANFRRITSKRDGTLKQRRGGTEIPRLRPRHGFVEQRFGIWCGSAGTHPVIA